MAVCAERLFSAQGIEAEIPEQTAERFVRNWSEKPGFCVPGTQKCAQIEHYRLDRVQVDDWFNFEYY
jgi:hypothetical protein